MAPGVSERMKSPFICGKVTLTLARKQAREIDYIWQRGRVEIGSKVGRGGVGGGGGDHGQYGRKQRHRAGRVALIAWVPHVSPLLFPLCISVRPALVHFI